MLLTSHGELKADFLALEVNYFVSNELLLFGHLLNAVLVKAQEPHEELSGIFEILSKLIVGRCSDQSLLVSEGTQGGRYSLTSL